MNKLSEESEVVGLYSFPKSGNTWLRAIVAAITDIPDGPGMLQKYVTDTHYGKVLENAWSFQGKDWYFYKSHHMNVVSEHKGEEFKTDKILYIYRHPLDVFVSYLNFVSNNVSPQAGASLDVSFDSVDDLSKEDMQKLFNLFLRHNTLFPKNRKFGSVFENINNFKKLKEEGGKVHILRYEDLQDNFNATVGEICEFLGFQNIDVNAVFKNADERTKQNGKFFWKRQKNNYSNYLNENQINRFNVLYEDEMTELGYL